MLGDTLKISDAVTGHGADDGLDIRTTGGAAEIMNREINSISLGTSNTKRLMIDDFGKVSINNSVPMMRFHVTDSIGQHLLLENNLALNTSQKSELFFRQGNYYTGAIKSIGTGLTTAHLGIFTGSQNAAGLIPERLSISNSGFVGIGDMII